MNRKQLRDAFQLDNYFVFHQEINYIPAIERNAFVFQRPHDARFEGDVTKGELSSKALMIRRFKDTRPNCLVYFNRSANYGLSSGSGFMLYE